MQGWLLFIHLIAVVIWLGGMFVVTQCLHPVLQTLPGPERVRVIVPTLARFFSWVTVAIVLIWASGLAMIAAVWPIRPPAGWHLMITAGLAMTVIFIWIRAVLFVRARKALAASEPAVAGRALGLIRTAVLTNLALGTAAIAGVTILR